MSHEHTVSRSAARARTLVATVVAVVTAATLGAVAPPAAAAEPSWSDRPGWPVATDLGSARAMNWPIEGSTGTSGWSKHSSPVLADIDRDGRLEIAIGSLDGRVYVYNDNGSTLWNRYLDAPDAQAGPVNGSPAVGDIDGDGQLEVVAGSDNGWVFAWGPDGTLEPGWPQFTGWNADHAAGKCATNACTGVVAGPTLADLDGNGTAEVVVGSYSHKMWVWDGRGNVQPGWPRDVWDGIASGAAVGDINGDGRPEIVFGSDVESDCGDCRPYGTLSRGGLLHAVSVTGEELPGWPFRTDSFMHSTPVLADLDHDSRLEVVAGGGYFPSGTTTRGHKLWVVGSNGALRWAFQTRGVLLASPAIGDVDGDGWAEIAIGDVACLDGGCPGGMTYVLDHSGGLRWSSVGSTTTAPAGSGGHFGGPVLADVTGDGRAEVVTTDGNWHVKAFDTTTGTVVADTGTNFALFGSAAVGDLDGNGTNEVVAGSAVLGFPQAPTLEQKAGAGRIHVWNTAGRGGLLFPQYQSRVLPIDRSRTPIAPTGNRAKVYRFWSPAFGNAHFFTTNAAEAVQIIDTDVSWLYEGSAFTAIPASGSTCSEGSAIHRFYSPVFKTHFYTASDAERANIVQNDRNWTYEGVAYCAYAGAQSGAKPLYRFWSPGFGKHFFTADQAEADHIRAVDRNWTYEGVAYYVLP